MEFNAQTFEMIQNLVFPLVKSLAGFDVEEFVGEKSELFIKVGDGLSEVAALFMLVGTALEDGKLSADELEAIIAEASDLPEALEAIISVFDSDEDEVVE